MKREVNTDCIMDRFGGGLILYMSDYFASKNGMIYRPKVNYTIPNEDYIRENWKSVCEEIRWLKPLSEYSKEIKAVAVQYLPIFFKDYPQFADAECLQPVKK